RRERDSRGGERGSFQNVTAVGAVDDWRHSFTFRSSRSVHGNGRVVGRTLRTSRGATGEAPWSQLRLTYVNTAATSSSPSAASAGMSRLYRLSPTVTGPCRPPRTMRIILPGGPSTHSESTSGGARPSCPKPVGLWQATQGAA